MRFVFTVLTLVSIGFSSNAHAGYKIAVCGTTSDRVQKFFAEANGQAEARRDALNKCERATGRSCIEPICQAVFQPTSVSELPPKVQKQLKARLAAIDRNAKQRLAVGRRTDGWDEYSGVRAVAEQARKNREAELEKVLEFARECQSMSGCPSRIR